MCLLTCDRVHLLAHGPDQGTEARPGFARALVWQAGGDLLDCVIDQGPQSRRVQGPAGEVVLDDRGEGVVDAAGFGGLPFRGRARSACQGRPHDPEGPDDAKGQGLNIGQRLAPLG